MKTKFKSVLVESPYDKTLPDNRNFIEFEGKHCVIDSIEYMKDTLDNIQFGLELNETTFKKYFSVSLEFVEYRHISSISREPLESESLEVENLGTLELLIEKVI